MTLKQFFFVFKQHNDVILNYLREKSIVCQQDRYHSFSATSRSICTCSQGITLLLVKVIAFVAENRLVACTSKTYSRTHTKSFINAREFSSYTKRRVTEVKGDANENPLMNIVSKWIKKNDNLPQKTSLKTLKLPTQISSQQNNYTHAPFKLMFKKNIGIFVRYMFNNIKFKAPQFQSI